MLAGHQLRKAEVPQDPVKHQRAAADHVHPARYVTPTLARSGLLIRSNPAVTALTWLAGIRA